MRRTVAVVMGIIVAASCIPWLRDQHFFSAVVGVTAIVLAGLLVFAGVRALSTLVEAKASAIGLAVIWLAIP